ncbi:helix-turn-helix domain-containing protein [Pedobacter sp. AW31-3R]|uniref:helix-turn-helix domain-containing protein n=1 Tax=Pedobacter sp. AW31-3R TaxID=3445781 RepID=UPI003FA06FEC
MKPNHQKYYRTIGENIRRIRLEQQLSQQRLADNCDKVDRAKISDIENAKEDFMFSTLLDVCDALHIQLAELITEHPK